MGGTFDMVAGTGAALSTSFGIGTARRTEVGDTHAVGS